MPAEMESPRDRAARQMPALKAVFAEPVRECMLRWADEFYPLEVGGVLLGYRLGGRVEIAHAIGPGPGASHGRFRFEPDSEWQFEQISLLYESSGRRLSYLGDWHTHPRGRPTPSRRDRDTMRAIAHYPEARCPEPIMLILGGRPGSWSCQAHGA
jgi:integrative and conjugative element protein (TIGR02256 family)